MMTRKRLPILVSFVFMTALLSACNRSVDLKFRPQPGDKRVIQIRNDMNVTISFMGTEQPLPKSPAERYSYEVQSVDAAGVATVKVTTNLESLLGMQAAMFEMMEAGANPLGKIGDFDLTATIAPDGTVQSVSGMEPVLEKLLGEMKAEMQKQMAQVMASLPPQAQAMMASAGGLDGAFEEIAKGFREEFGDDTVRGKLQAMTSFFPAEPVRVGSTWTKEETSGGVKSSTTYTVAARGGGAMNINYKTTFTGREEGAGALGADASYSGEKSGVIQVDEATGWVVNGKSDAKLDGFLKGNGAVYIESSAG